MSIIDRLPELKQRIQVEDILLLDAKQREYSRKIDEWLRRGKDLEEKASFLTIVDQTLEEIRAELIKQDEEALQQNPYIDKLQKPIMIFGVAGEMGRDKAPIFRWFLRWNDVRNPYVADRDFEDTGVGYGKCFIKVKLDENQQLTFEGKKSRVLLMDADPAEIAALIGMAYIEPGKQPDRIEQSSSGRVTRFYPPSRRY